jgi:6-pyruvoyltetrahydropterin/6-carboxytetrahydropterin synthase
VRLTRRYHFSASHRLHTPKLSEAENAEIYGKCANPYGHGHNYAIEVTVRGCIDEATGRVVDLGSLDAYVSAEVIRAYDHQDLNALSEFRATVPTSENLGLAIRRRLEARWRDVFPAGPLLDRVRVEETERNIFEIQDEKKK